MRLRKRYISLPLLSLLLFYTTLTPPLAHGQQKPTVIRVSELSLRRAAIKTVMPAFPQESIAKRAKGVVVAELVFDPTGDVFRARILEAPDSLTGAAVLEAVKQWKFRPQSVQGSEVYIRGKLTFYYVINERGEGRVNNPRQIG